MPRIPESRAPGRVSTARQEERRAAILRAAARLGAEHGLDRVQMNEVAQSAGVALGTLYRYYPSKHHVFAAVLDTAVRDLPEPAGIPADPVVGVTEFLSRATAELLRHPRLARAMLVSMNAVRGEEPVLAPGGATGAENVIWQDYSMPDRILAAGGILAPTAEDRRLARLLEQCVYGILTWATAGRLTTDEALSDIRRACELLLSPWQEQG
ncbi:TetR family transcriptional regulator [Nocardia stercoris]|uniref:TetR/AcrR family transcriptional regulator n=1 Tax=Nocardia stercoris TaxID=2483361 RepID=A0A3M2L7Y5_9NOCA|nr:TetR family transcriptional regulator [Nocardia stercoris]RMI33474.1 TetR/AcrR family transcriptional regulator [Nocardia stercoris]